MAVTSPTPYPTLFRTFIEQALKRSLAQVQSCTGALPEEVREQACHALSFGLKYKEAWSLTRLLLLQLAPKMEQLGHRGDWLPYLEQGLQQSQSLQDGVTTAELCLHIGHLYRLLSQFELAQQWLLTSAAHFEELGKQQGRARGLNQLAYLAWQQHRYPDAIQLATTALRLFDESDLERASSYNILGEVAKVQRDWSTAEQFHQTALALWQAHHDQRRTAWSLQNLGATFAGQQKYAAAVTCYEQAIVILRQIEDIANLAVVQMNLGIAHSMTGQGNEAIARFTAAEAIFRKLHDRHNLAKVLTSKGIDLLNLQQWSQAESAFRASIALFQQVDDQIWSTNAMDGLGMVYLHQQLYEEASAIFETAINGTAQMVDTPLLQSIVQSLQGHLVQAQSGKART